MITLLLLEQASFLLKVINLLLFKWQMVLIVTSAFGNPLKRERQPKWHGEREEIKY